MNVIDVYSAISTDKLQFYLSVLIISYLMISITDESEKIFELSFKKLIMPIFLKTFKYCYNI